jgi:glutaredoxin
MTGRRLSGSGGGHPGVGASHRVPEVTLITSEGCHYCEHAREVLDSIRVDHPLEVTEIALESEIGQSALARWRVPFPPLLLIDGELFGYGRISARKLRRNFEA